MRRVAPHHSNDGFDKFRLGHCFRCDPALCGLADGRKYDEGTGTWWIRQRFLYRNIGKNKDLAWDSGYCAFNIPMHLMYVNIVDVFLLYTSDDLRSVFLPSIIESRVYFPPYTILTLSPANLPGHPYRPVHNMSKQPHPCELGLTFQDPQWEPCLLLTLPSPPPPTSAAGGHAVLLHGHLHVDAAVRGGRAAHAAGRRRLDGHLRTLGLAGAVRTLHRRLSPALPARHKVRSDAGRSLESYGDAVVWVTLQRIALSVMRSLFDFL